jgi:hypothetical protein
VAATLVVMHTREPGRWIAAVGALLTVLAPAAAKADGPFAPDGKLILAVGALFVLPSEVGVAIRAADASSARFVLGWSWQVPVSQCFGEYTLHHRLLGAVDLLPNADGADWRGRFGYRYARRWAFGGVGVGVDGAGANLSPEVGVKFAHADMGHGDDIDLSLHVLVRAEITPTSGIRGATILLGWNLF